MRPAVLLALCLTLICSFACAPTGTRVPVTDQVDQRVAVDERVAIAFSAARTALEVLDTAEVAYLELGTAQKTWKGEDDPRLVASAARIETLKKIRASLERLRQYLTEAVPADFKNVLSDLEVAVAEAKHAGLNVPAQVSSSLKLLKEVL